MIKTIILIIVTIFLPPLGVFLVAGCGVDVLINILLTCLGYFPGHIHAFYVEYVYYKKRDEARSGIYTSPAPGVYSSRVQRGGRHGVVPVQPPPPPMVQGGNVHSGAIPPQPPPPPPPQQQQQYGTI